MLKISLFLIIYLSFSDFNAEGAKIHSSKKLKRSGESGNSLVNENHGRSIWSNALPMNSNIQKHIQQFSAEKLELRQKGKKSFINKRIQDKSMERPGLINGKMKTAISKQIQDTSTERDELEALPTRRDVLQIIETLPNISIPENSMMNLCTKVVSSSSFSAQNVIGKAYTNNSAACFSVCHNMEECIGISFNYEEGLCLFYNNETDGTTYDDILETVFFKKMRCANEIKHVYDLIERNDIIIIKQEKNDDDDDYDDPDDQFSCTTSDWYGFFHETEPLKMAQNVGRTACLNLCYSDTECQAVNYIALPGLCYLLKATIVDAQDLILTELEDGFQYYHVPKDCENGHYKCQPLDNDDYYSDEHDDDDVISCGIPHPSHKPNIGEMAGRRRIMGGTEAEQHSYPWIASLHLAKTDDHKCQGVLLPSSVCADKSDVVLTAAHCTYKNGIELEASDLHVYFGKHNLSEIEYDQIIIKVNEIVRHPDYWDDDYAFDYALLHLANPVEYDEFIRPVCLPKFDIPPSKPKSCIVAGWGDLSILDNEDEATTLQQMIDPVIDDNTCAYAMEERNITYDNESMLCAGNLDRAKDTCLGDSGSPLVCYEDGQYFVYGLVSFGAESGSCNRDGMPGVYSRVSAEIGWIEETKATWAGESFRAVTD